MTQADQIELMMKVAGNIKWGSKKASILDWWLNDLLPANWCDMSTVTFEDGSVWTVWTW